MKFRYDYYKFKYLARFRCDEHEALSSDNIRSTSRIEGEGGLYVKRPLGRITFTHTIFFFFQVTLVQSFYLLSTREAGI